MMKCKLKSDTCVYLFFLVMCFIVGCFYISLFSLKTEGLYSYIDSGLKSKVAASLKNLFTFTLINQSRALDNHSVADVFSKKVVKYCFHLSYRPKSLKALATIREIDLETAKSTTEDTGHVRASKHDKIHSKNESITCDRFVSIPFYMGRMGNQMFEIASVIGMAYKYDAIPVIPQWFPLNKYFDLPNRINTKSKVNKIANIVKCIPKMSAVFYNCSKEFAYQTNVSIQGYLQSWKYFVNASEIIRKTFKLKSKHLINAKRFLSNVSIDGYQRICIHVRRGDITMSTMVAKGHSVAGLDFIEKAKNIFISNDSRAQFLVVSDDKPWCRRNLKDVIISPLTDPGDDMALMTLSDHVIVTVGTFGWWGAWLSGGTTVYYNKYARPGSGLASRISKEDYFPNTWIGIS